MTTLETVSGVPLSQIRAWLEGFTYMPGWEFCAYDSMWEGPVLCIQAVLPDSRNPTHGDTLLNIKTFIPPCESPQQFYAWLMYRLARIAVHEVREWSRVNGVLLDDPHREGANDELPPIT